jgi:hypothetical protein
VAQHAGMPAAAASPHRIVLVADPRAPRPAPAVRRYALARLKLAERRAAGDPKFAHLRASYD